MLPFFPSGHPGELFASQVGRYHVLSGNRTTRLTYDELFGIAPFSLTYWFPLHLDRLSERLPGDRSETILSLLQENTLLPLFQQFYGLSLAEMHSGKQAAAAISLPRRIVGESGTTHLCLDCQRQDVIDEGAPYIHRAHQIPGISACWRHGTRLIDCCPRCRCPIETSKDLILMPWRGCACGWHPQEEGNDSEGEVGGEVETSLARFAKEILESELIPLHPRALTQLYRIQTLELGFRRGGTIDRTSLLSAIEDFYGEQLLANMDWAYRRGKKSGWFHIFNGKSANEVPLGRHLILAHFLFGEAGVFRSKLEWAKQIKLDQPVRCHKRSYSVPQQVTTGMQSEVPINNLMGRLVQKAKECGLDIDGLWKEEYGAMKKLVKSHPEGVKTIAARLVLAKRLPSNGVQFGEGKDQLDAKRAAAIRAAGEHLYRQPGKPKKISMNVLMRHASLRSYGWPTTTDFPQTRAACEAWKESTWHFFARRVLWTLAQFPEGTASVSKIADASGLEYHKVFAVADYFMSAGYRVTAEPFADQLKRLEIPRDWPGPCPDRKFYATGRRYVRASLRGACKKDN